MMPEVARRGDLPRDQVAGDRGEVLEVVDVLLLHAPPCARRDRTRRRRGCSRRTYTPPARQPRGPEDAAVPRHLGDLEAAVSVEERRRRPVRLAPLRRHDEVRDLRAVLRRGLELLGLHPRRVEERRHRLDLLRAAPPLPASQSDVGGREVLVGEEEGVRRGRSWPTNVAVPSPGVGISARFHAPPSRESAVMRLRTLSSVWRSTRSFVRSTPASETRSRRLEEHVEAARAAQEVVDRRPRAESPRGRSCPPTVQSLRRENRSRSRKNAAEPRVLGHVELDEAVAEEEERLLPEERRASAMTRSYRPSLRISLLPLAETSSRLALEDRPGLGERSAALPELDDPRDSPRP